jgi:hypothetical protein
LRYSPDKFYLTKGIKDNSGLFETAQPPDPVKIILMLLNRDHGVCEFFYIFEEPQNLISYDLKVLKDGGLSESYYRSKHRISTINGGAEAILRKIRSSVPG